MNVSDWLRGLGLERYAAAFQENDVTLELLPQLSAEDLKELGVVSVGHRRQLLTAIGELGKQAAETDLAAKVVSVPRGSSVSSDPDSAISEAERRQITVMFCDLVGSTALSAHLDPEDMREVSRAYQQCCACVIAMYGGFIAKYLGDGVLAYFGYPRAHEDDAERSVRSGLDLLAAIPRLETPAAEPLQVRIGIATGLVVVGDLVGEGAAQERAVVGETPNLAARLQSLALPNSVVIADATRRLLHGAFRLANLGAQTIKGFDAPVTAWAVEGTLVSESRFEARGNPERGGLVGRDEERSLLLDRQLLAWRGEGQVVLISGEPGIGKSRLSTWLADQLPAGTYTRLRLQCSPYHTESALYPFIMQLERAAGFEADDPAELRLEKLELVLAMGSAQVATVVPVLAMLLSIPANGRFASSDLSAVQQRRQTLNALLDQLVGLSRTKPVLLLFEDAHWADATSLELLDLIVERIARLPVLAIVTHRPEFAPRWSLRRQVTTITLSRLDRRHVHAIVARLTNGKALPPEVLDQIIAKTDGVPLFIEELTKTVLESGLLSDTPEGFRLNAPLPPLAIPATLQDSLMERLDRLASVRGVAQVGAVIGREFSYALISEVAGLDPAHLTAALAQLEKAELVFQRGVPPDAHYTFKHALVRDTAYATLLKGRRQQLHQRIAEAIRDRFPERAEAEPEVVAHHFTEAGLLQPAIEWFGKAGQRAKSRVANIEAVQSFSNALALIDKLPASEDRDRLELSFRLALGLPLLATRGYASVEVENNYAAASRLADQLGDGEAQFASTRGLWNCIYDRAELDRSVTLAQRLLALAGQEANSEKQGLALRALGSSRMSKDEFVLCEEAFDACIAVCASLPFGAGIEDHGEAPQIVASQYKGLSLCIRGYPDRGLDCTRAALAHARQAKHPISVAFAVDILCVMYMLRRDYRKSEELSAELSDIASEHDFAFWIAASEISRGGALANLGRADEGLLLAERGLANWIKTNATLHVPTWSSYLVDAALISGRLARAEDALTTGLRLAKENGEAFVLAELERLQGRLHLAQDRPEEARAAFQAAIETAERQGAKLYRLRAARDLARLLIDTDDRCGAERLLSPILGDYPEHRDGLDFQEAAALLAPG